MLKRKSTVQKSIRFDENLAEDLEYLANELERTQNDLVNIAVENLIKENKYYFAKLIIVENLFEFLECDAKKGYFEIPEIKVEVLRNEFGKYQEKVLVLDKSGEMIEDFVRSYEDIEDLEHDLITLAQTYVDFNSTVVQDYLKRRLDYK